MNHESLREFLEKESGLIFDNMNRRCEHMTREKDLKHLLKPTIKPGFFDFMDKEHQNDESEDNFTLFTPFYIRGI